MSDSHLAVIDIGKTNKKVIVFNRDLKIVDSAYKSFDEYVEEGVHYEDVANAVSWFREQLKAFAARYSIGAISTTTHGATAMCIDSSGELAVPPVAYTTPADEVFRKEFFDTFGSREELQKLTATAEIGDMINLAKLLYFCKKKWPERFARVSWVLNYPQYIGYLLTGKVGAEPTYVGCHTYLFDFARKRYSHVAEKLGLEDKLPPTIAKSWDVLGKISAATAAQTGLPTDCIVTMGIHDSNASLLPYLVKGYDNFVLNSTGTWCVAMHPTQQVSFAEDELGKLVFYNLDAFFNPVKTSIFMGGLEFETYTTLLKEINGDYGRPAFDPGLYQKVIDARNSFILPSVVRGTGIFPNAEPRVVEGSETYTLREIKDRARVPALFRDPAAALAVLELSLALQTRAALDMVGFHGKGTIFTEGGWRRDKAYNALLAALYPQSTAVTTGLAEATAFGAAILGKAALEGTTPMETASCFEIETETAATADLPGLDEYAKAFAARL